MIWFKSCTKCDGDLTQAMDMDGSYVTCVQCGRHLNEIEQALIENSTSGQVLTTMAMSSVEQRAG